MQSENAGSIQWVFVQTMLFPHTVHAKQTQFNNIHLNTWFLIKTHLLPAKK